MFDQTLEEKSKVFERKTLCNAKSHLPTPKVQRNQWGRHGGLPAVRQASEEPREITVNNTLLLEMEKQVPRRRGNRSGPLWGTSQKQV